MGNRVEMIKSEECEFLEYTNYLDFKIYRVFQCTNQKVLLSPSSINIEQAHEASIENFENGLYTMNELTPKIYYLRPTDKSSVTKNQITGFGNSSCSHSYFKDSILMCNTHNVMLYNFKDKSCFVHKETVEIDGAVFCTENKVWIATEESVKLWNGNDIEVDIKIKNAREEYRRNRVFLKSIGKRLYYQNTIGILSIIDIQSKSEVLNTVVNGVLDEVFETPDFIIGKLNSEILIHDKSFQLLKKFIGSHLTQLKDNRLCFYHLETKNIMIWDALSINSKPIVFKKCDDIQVGLTQLNDGRLLTFGMKKIYIWDEFLPTIPQINVFKNLLSKDLYFDVGFSFH